ncbi:hypothetical protein V8J88_04840 [Massilia sp. W12]|uniref:hypothetical protein n=1 Tax=Massilia sp. W12 TaxID=3126507 RepID=UPI0030CE0061
MKGSSWGRLVRPFFFGGDSALDAGAQAKKKPTGSAGFESISRRRIEETVCIMRAYPAGIQFLFLIRNIALVNTLIRLHDNRMHKT